MFTGHVFAHIINSARLAGSSLRATSPFVPDALPGMALDDI